MIFEPRQAGGVIGWTVGHRGLRPVHLRCDAGLGRPRLFFAGLAVFALIGTAITW